MYAGGPWGAPVRTSCGGGSPWQGSREQAGPPCWGLPTSQGGLGRDALCLLALPGPWKWTYPLPHLSALGREGVPALQEMAQRVTMSLCVHFHTQVFTKPGLGVRSALVSPLRLGAPGPLPRCPLPEGRPDPARLSETRFLAVNLPICGLLLGRSLT